MPQTISIDQVKHVAKLARLAIPEDRLPQFASQLESILGYVDKLREVNVEGVEPTAHPLPLKNVMREDVVGPMFTTEQVLANAPDRDDPFFKVPKVIGGDEDSAG
jgi:aspartyl-tRNA(Asn)/glutamyl-tRNA(Gln) amidotransferase subunit C